MTSDIEPLMHTNFMIDGVCMKSSPAQGSPVGLYSPITPSIIAVICDMVSEISFVFIMLLSSTNYIDTWHLYS